MKPVHYFKRHQRDGIYHFYEVHGGEGKTREGYQIVLNLLNAFPIVITEHNYESDPTGLTGTWCQFEVGEPISKQEYQQMFEKVISHPNVDFR